MDTILCVIIFYLLFIEKRYECFDVQGRRQECEGSASSAERDRPAVQPPSVRESTDQPGPGMGAESLSGTHHRYSISLHSGPGMGAESLSGTHHRFSTSTLVRLTVHRFWSPISFRNSV